MITPKEDRMGMITTIQILTLFGISIPCRRRLVIQRINGRCFFSIPEKEFWSIADTFRDPRVWWIKNKEWYKYTLRGKPQAFGPVYLNKDQVDNFEKRQKKIFNK